MSKKKRFGVSEALSRGISETIHVVENNSGVFRNIILPLSRIELDPDNPRKLAISLQDIKNGLNTNDPLIEKKQAELENLKALSTTILKNGIINPIVVYKGGEFYRVVAGERRCLASILAGKLEIEARVFNEKPKPFELKLIQWVENTAREDLSLDERINNINDIIQEYQNQHTDTPVTATFLKTITGLSLPQATYYLTVLNAPVDVSEMIEKGRIQSLDKAALIAGIESPDARQEALQACVNGCSLKELRKIISRLKSDIKKSMAPSQTAKRGRTATRINMGFTFHPSVVQTIVTSVLNQNEFRKHTDGFLKVDWTHFEETSRAFKKLIEILEHEVTT